MNVLLDTHVLLWWFADDSTLRPDARRIIGSRQNVVAVSAASTWELSIKRALGKVDMPDGIEEEIQRNAFVPLPISLADGLLAGSLPRHHDDPFDRMLVAQAWNGSWTIVTRDQRIAAYGVPTLIA